VEVALPVEAVALWRGQAPAEGAAECRVLTLAECLVLTKAECRVQTPARCLALTPARCKLGPAPECLVPRREWPVVEVRVDGPKLGRICPKATPAWLE
jgi:hypothetical protein